MLVLLVAIMATDLAWVTLAVQARTFFKSSRAVRATNRVGATVIVGAAAVVADR